MKRPVSSTLKIHSSSDSRSSSVTSPLGVNFIALLKRLNRISFNLVESTRIIRSLITQNKLGERLEDHSPEQLSVLLDNVSPAKLAIEVEVLSTTIPLVAVYYFDASQEKESFIKQLEELAIKYEDHIKCVVVDAQQLFSLVEDAEIENLPAMLLVKDREIIDRLEGEMSIELLEQFLLKHRLA